MLRVALQDGISGIVATPHVLDGVYDNTKKRISDALSGLRSAQSGVQLHMGAEIRICRNLAERIGSNELPLLNDRNFVLLELPAYLLPPLPELEKIVSNLRALDINPIFAHPERNAPILGDF